MVKTAGIIIIGNEILSGIVKESNATFMAKALNARGIEVCRISIIPDDVDEIAKTVREFSQAFTYVYTSGGIGPTHDDVTIEGLSKAFGVKTVIDGHLQCLLHERYDGNLTSEKLKMAQVPKGAVLIKDETLKFPLITFRNVYVLPGVPKLLREKFLVSAKYFHNGTVFSKKVEVRGTESEIAPFLNEIVAGFEGVKIGVYPARDNGRSHVLITLESYGERGVQSALGQIIAGLSEKEIIRVE